MTELPRAPKVVRLASAAPMAPEPYEGEYGPLSEEFYALVEKAADQEKLAGGKVLARFEW
jgi:hypothetical protein